MTIVDVQDDFYLLSELVHDYIGIVGSVKDAFNERVKAWQSWQSVQVWNLYLYWLANYFLITEGLEQEEGEQGEGRVGQQAGQGQPVEAGDC